MKYPIIRPKGESEILIGLSTMVVTASGDEVRSSI